jgi:hypothetical protein
LSKILYRASSLVEASITKETQLSNLIALTLDIYSHISLDLEKQAGAKLNAALTSRLQ